MSEAGTPYTSEPLSPMLAAKLEAGGKPEPTLPTKLVAEFLGTFLLVFTVGCNVLSSNALWGGVSIASVLMVAIFALGKISGANFNPAVSLALGLSKAMRGPGLEMGVVMAYMLVQLLAGVAAAFCYQALFSPVDTPLMLKPAGNFVQVGLCELLYTLMLCFVVLNVAAIDKSEDAGNGYYGLAIGFVIVAGAYGAGSVSGGCFNPAVAFGIDAGSLFAGSGWSPIYAVFELCGAALAALLFRVVRPKEFDRDHGPWSEFVSEFLGTFMLVLTVGLNVLGKSPAGAFSIAASLMCMIFSLGAVSGAHFNPAVTLAIVASGRGNLGGPKVAMYLAGQFLGGLGGALCFSVIRGGSWALGPGPNFGWIQVALAETVFTGLLCFAVLSVAVSKITNSPTMFGLAIGACITVGGNAVGGISGAALNPAVACSISLAHVVNSGSGANLVAALAYTLAEIAGATVAAGFFLVTQQQEKVKS